MAALLLLLLMLLPYGAVSAPTDAPSDLIVRDTATDLIPRNIVDDFNTFVSNIQDGVSLDDIKQGILPDFFAGIPSTQEIKDQLGLNDSAIDQLPIEVLNIPFVSIFSLY